MEFTQNNTELDVGRCSMDFGVLENLYVEVEIAYLSRTNAKLNYFRFRGAMLLVKENSCRTI